MGRVASFSRLDSTDRKLFLEAAVLLAAARLAIRFIPFARLAGHLGRHMAETPPSATPVALETSRRVSRAIRLAARNLPWESVCLPQAIAAKAMLKRRGVPCTLYLGVLRNEKFHAHAWVRAGGLVVTGDRGREGFTVVSTFA